MIYFKTIRWKNFLSTGNTFTEIDFTKHKSTLIVGENGAGKSTLLDALCYSLYGKPFRKINKPQLINSINSKGLEVEVEFSIGKREYKVRRGMKPSIFEILQDGKPINQDAEARDYQEMFERSILKLSHKSFSQIVILGSAAFVPFMQLSAQHRRDVIEDLLDIQIFSTMNTLLKGKLSANRDTIITTDFGIKSTGEKIELYKRHIDSLKQNNEELVKQKEAKVNELTANIQRTNADIERLQTEIEEKSSNIGDQDKVRARLEKIRDIARQVDLRLEKLRKETQFFTSHDDCPTCRQGIAHEHKNTIISKSNSQITEIESGKGKIAEELDSINSRLAEISSISSEISTRNREVSDLNVQCRTWASFITDINKEIESLNITNKHIESTNVELKTHKDELRELIASKETLIIDKQVLDIANTLLKDTGIKTKIIKQYVPIMNKLINKYLASMDFFVNFELNEGFEETIKSRFRDEFSYESFSEGEKSRIDLALLFTWRAVAKLRNSASTNLLILDEVFDSSMDVQGSDELMKILQTLAGDTNVFVISHKTDQLVDKFANVIRFEKHKNFSRMAT